MIELSVMKKIVIDARGLRTSSGRYVERLVDTKISALVSSSA
jgi:hypothetical protein